MAKKIAFFVTAGRKVSFLSTTGEIVIFKSSQRADSFFLTKPDTNVFLTGNRQDAFFSTISNSPIFLSSSRQVAFAVSPDLNAPKELMPKWGTFSINTDQSQIVCPDGTGEYNATTNPGGFNPESAGINANRPKRSAVQLWTVYKLRSEGGVTEGPSTQPQSTPYIYTLSLPTNTDGTPKKGLYQIYLVVAPLSATYDSGTDWVAVSSQPDYYLGSSALMVDSTVQNCINRMRYEFLQSVMCGKCNEAYLEVYGLYVGMLNAMESGEWTTAVEIYEKLKEICSSQEQSCTC